MFDVDVWLVKNGFNQLTDLFRDNEIDAEVLLELTNEDLKEMGINVVGDRLMFKHHLKELSRRERFNKRIESLWEGQERVFFNDSEQNLLVRVQNRDRG